MTTITDKTKAHIVSDITQTRVLEMAEYGRLWWAIVFTSVVTVAQLALMVATDGDGSKAWGCATAYWAFLLGGLYERRKALRLRIALHEVNLTLLGEVVPPFKPK